MARRGLEYERTAHEGGVKGAAGLNILLGLAIIITPFIALSQGAVSEFLTVDGELSGAILAAFWMNIAVGIVVTGLSAYNAWAASRHMTPNVVAPAGVNVLLGLWLVVWAFIAPINVGYFWANVILGLLVAALAGYNSWAGYMDRRPTVGA